MKTPRPTSTGGRARHLGALTRLTSLLLSALPLAAADPPTITGTGQYLGRTGRGGGTPRAGIK